MEIRKNLKRILVAAGIVGAVVSADYGANCRKRWLENRYQEKVNKRLKEEELDINVKVKYEIAPGDFPFTTMEYRHPDDAELEEIIRRYKENARSN